MDNVAPVASAGRSARGGRSQQHEPDPERLHEQLSRPLVGARDGSPPMRIPTRDLANIYLNVFRPKQELRRRLKFYLQRHRLWHKLVRLGILEAGGFSLLDLVNATGKHRCDPQNAYREAIRVLATRHPKQKARCRSALRTLNAVARFEIGGTRSGWDLPPGVYCPAAAFESIRAWMKRNPSTAEAMDGYSTDRFKGIDGGYDPIKAENERREFLDPIAELVRVLAEQGIEEFDLNIKGEKKRKVPVAVLFRIRNDRVWRMVRQALHDRLKGEAQEEELLACFKRWERIRELALTEADQRKHLRLFKDRDTPRHLKQERRIGDWPAAKERIKKKSDPGRAIDAFRSAVIPSLTAEQMETLLGIVRDAQKHSPDDQRRFVDDVNLFLDVHSLRIQIDGDEAEDVYRLKLVSASGRSKARICLAAGSGGLRGFKRSTIGLVSVHQHPDGRLEPQPSIVVEQLPMTTPTAAA